MTRIQELPFGELTWENFERLCYRIASLDTDVEECRRYGRLGQAQQGIDIYARRSDGRYDVWQCKRYSTVSSADLRRSVDRFLHRSWVEKAECLTLAVSTSLQDTTLQEAVEAQAARLSERGIRFQVLDREKLSGKLKELPSLVDDFFGRAWVESFCGREVVSILKNQRHVLGGEDIAKLRSELSRFYRSYFSTLERGLGRLSSDSRVFSNLPELRTRFVVPDVIVRSAVSSVVLPTVKSIGGDGRERSDRLTSSDRQSARESDTATVEEVFRRPVGDWVSSGRRLALVGEAGSGKSAFLRFLTLDLLSEEPRLGRAAQAWGDYLPVLIPFSRWARMVSDTSGGVAADEVIRSFLAEFSVSEESISLVGRLFSDSRLLVLVDGVDEWPEEASARAVFDQIETVSTALDLATIITGRPYGFDKLGPLRHVWSAAELAPLDESQQRRLAMNWVIESQRQPDRVVDEQAASLVVEVFFRDLNSSGQLSALGGSPLLLTGLIALRIRNVALPRDRIQVYDELIKLLLEIHPNERSGAARDHRRRFAVLVDGRLRQQTLACLAYETMDRGLEVGIDRRVAEAILTGFLQADDGAALSADEARAGAREILAVDAETTGILVEKAPQEIGFFHAIFGEYLAGCHAATWSLEEQVAFVKRHCTEQRFRTVIIALLHSLGRPSDVDTLVTAIQSAPTSARGTVIRAQLLAEIAFGSSRRSGELARQIATEVFDQIETAHWQPGRQALLRVVLQNTSNGLRAAVGSKIAEWYPESHWSREQAIRATTAWQPDSDIFETLLRNIHDSSMWNRRAASNALSRLFLHDDAVERKLVSEVRRPTSPEVSAMLLWTLVRGWPANPELETLVNSARASRCPVIRLYGIAAAVALGLQTEDDRDDLLELCRPSSLHLFEVKEDIVWALKDGWPDDTRVFDQLLAAWCNGHRDQRSIDFNIAGAVLVEGWSADDRVVDHLCELIRAKHFSLSMGPCSWDVLRRTHRAHPVVQPTIDERLTMPESESKLFDREFAYAAVVSSSEEAKRTLLKRLADSRLKFWPVWALLDAWGMEDPEVAHVLRASAEGEPSELQHFAHHLPAIIGNTSECRDTLLEIGRHPGLERADFVAGGLASLDPSLWSDEVVDMAVNLCQTRHPLYNPTAEVISAFGWAPPVRKLAVGLLDSKDAPLVAMVKKYGEDPVLRGRILQRLAPLPKDLRLQIVDHAAGGGLDTPEFTAVLEGYQNENDPEVRTSAAVHHYSKARGSALPESTVDGLRDELLSRGPDMDAIQQAAFGGLVTSGNVDFFAKMMDPYNGKPVRINGFSIGLERNPRLMREMAEHWREISDSLGDGVLSRLSFFGIRDARGVWEQLAPFVNSNKSILGDFLSFCRAESAPLGANVLGALERIEGGSVLLAQSCKRILEGDARDQGLLPFDSVAAAVAAARILGRWFSEDESNRAILERAASRGDAGAFVGLSTGWPDSEVIQLAYARLNSPNGLHLLWPDYIHLCARASTEGEFLRVLKRWVSSADGNIWGFLQECIEPVVSRLAQDEAAWRVVALDIESSQSGDALASFPRLLALAKRDDPWLVRWCERRLEGELAGKDLRTFGFDVVDGRFRPIAASILDVLFRARL